MQWGLLEELAQINTSVIDDPKEINSLRLELEQANENLSSKEYTIECMEKGIESSDSIYKWELNIWSSERLKLMEENSHLQEIISKKDNEIADLSAKNSGGAEVVPLSQE